MFLFKKKNQLIFIYLLIWLHWVLLVACGILSCGTSTLSRGEWDLVPLPGIEPRPPALGVQSLSHWTTREVPTLAVLTCNLLLTSVYIRHVFHSSSNTIL